jgi:hypothetical protein
MTKYRSKPVEIEAFQWDIEPKRGKTYPDWFFKEIGEGRATYHYRASDPAPTFDITTANGVVAAHPGDWIIREPSGIGCYPCKDDVFRHKYEAVE